MMTMLKIMLKMMMMMRKEEEEGEEDMAECRVLIYDCDRSPKGAVKFVRERKKGLGVKEKIKGCQESGWEDLGR